MEAQKCFGMIILSLIMLPMWAVHADILNNPQISISALRYEPFPAQPSSYLKLWINVENLGSKSVENLNIILEPQYPFYLDASENSTRIVNLLDGAQNAVIDYKLRIAPDAVEGDNELKIRYTLDGSNITYEQSMTINIQTFRANLDVVSVKNQLVSQGNITPLQITLMNKGDSALRDVSVKLDLAQAPFYTIDSIAEKKVNLINAGSEEVIEFDLLAASDAKCQPYKVPMALSYKSLNGTQFDKSDFLTLIVCTKPKITVELDSSAVLTSGTTGKFILNIVNPGVTDVKFLTVTLNRGDYEILSPSQIYIGNLKSDDFDTANFNIYARGSKAFLPLNVSLSYMDGNNKEYHEEKIINLRLYTNEELNKYQLVPPTSYTGLIILGVIVVILVYWLIRRRHKKK